MRKSLLVAVSFASAFAILVACGGSSDVSIPGATDGATTPLSDAAPTDASTIHDGAVTSDATDPPKDAGLVVNELPAPACHDLKQIGTLVPATPGAGDPPPVLPLSAIPPGLYVAKEIIEYGNSVNMDSPMRITADFTSTREYYLADHGVGTLTTAYTLDYKITEGMLSRTFVCFPMTPPTVPDYQIGASTNGFTIYVPSGPGAVETVRYERAD